MGTKKEDLTAHKAEIDRALNKVSAARCGRRCRTCAEPRVKAIIDRYFERLDAGEALPGLRAVHEQLLSKITDACYNAVRNHVIRCLKRSPTSGAKL